MGSSPCVHARTVVDVTQTSVNLVEAPKRIVTLAPSLGELAADLVGTDLERIVGVSEYTDEPAGLKKVTSVGSYTQLNLEKIVSLKPDLVLATLDGNPKDQVLHLRELGVPVVVVQTGSFKEIEDSIKMTSEALGASDQGKIIISRLRTGLQRFRDKAKKHPPLRTLLQMGDQPMVIAGRQSFLHEALEIIGAKNIYADNHSHYPRPSMEDILSRDPEVIVVLTFGEDLRPFKAIVQRWQQFPQIKAVKNKRVSILKSDALLRPTLRILEGIAQLERLLYGKG